MVWGVALVADFRNYIHHRLRLVYEKITTQMYCDTDLTGTLHCQIPVSLPGFSPARG